MKLSRKETKGRDEIVDSVDRSRSDMDEKLQDLDKIQKDVETVRETLEALDFGGTSEGSDAVEASMTGAEDVTVEVFDREDGVIDEMQEQSEEYEGDLHEHLNADEEDLDRISDASRSIDTEETISQLVRAKEAAVRDVEFLAEQVERAKEAREQSETAQREYQSKVHHGRT